MSNWYSRKFTRVLSVERLLWVALICAGVQHKLSELTSGNTVVHFYASWCGPCLRELPEIKAFMETPLGSQINFVFITEDREDQVKTFHDRYGFNIYRVNKLKDANVYSIPVTYLLNEKHEIVKSDLGSWDWNQENLKSEISTLIK